MRVDCPESCVNRRGLVSGRSLQGYLADKKQRPLRTLQWDFAEGPMVALGEGAASFERGTLVNRTYTANKAAGTTTLRDEPQTHDESLIWTGVLYPGGS